MLFFLKDKKKTVILFILIFFHLLLISIQVPLGDEENYLEKAIFSIFSPVQHGIIVLLKKVSDLWNGYFYLWQVQKQNNQMKEEMFYLRQENNILRRALEKLKKGKDIREFISAIHNSFLIAQVIGIDARNIYKSISINKGSVDGLKKDMIVLDKNGDLVGRVINPISLKEARIQLITDSDSGVGVIAKKGEAKGVLTGDAKGNCFFKYIYATQKVFEGEELVTSGLDNIFPSGIKVGSIVSVVSNGSLFKTIKVKPCFNFNDLDLVVIITNESREILNIE